MDKAKLEQLKELTRKAAHKTGIDYGHWWDCHDNELVEFSRSGDSMGWIGTVEDEDVLAYLAAVSPDVILELIAELERLQAENERLRAKCGE